MSRIRREHDVLLTRVSLAGMDVGEHWLEPSILRRVAEGIGEVVGDACTQYRYPRPALTVSPSRVCSSAEVTESAGSCATSRASPESA